MPMVGPPPFSFLENGDVQVGVNVVLAHNTVRS
jgi:hypothetical protein